MSRPKNTSEHYRTQKYQNMAQKNQKRPKIKIKSKIRIEGIIENKICSSSCVDPKIAFETYNEPKNSPLGPKKSKLTLKLSQHPKI